MLRGDAVINSNVIAFDTGEAIGTIDEVIVDDSHSQVIAFGVTDARSPGKDLVLPWGAVQSVALDVVIAWSRHMVVDIEHLYDVKRVAQGEMLSVGMHFMTREGHDLGAMEAVYFDERTGEVEGYEVRGGMFAHRTFGRSFVPAPISLTMEGRIALVPSEVLERMRGQTVHMDPPHSGNGSQQPSMDDQLGRYAWALFTDERRNGAKHGVLQTVLERCLGYVIMRDVRTIEGSWVAVAGQLVTQKVIARAREFHKEYELLEAIGIAQRFSSSS